MGQAFYKGGFEPRMNRKEATLILSLKWVPHLSQNNTRLRLREDWLTGSQRARRHERKGPKSPPNADAA